MAAPRGIVIVQPGPATPVPLEEPMTREGWNDYYEAIWASRLNARMHARYFAAARWWLAFASAVLQAVVFLGSAGAVGTLFAEWDPRIPTYVGLAVVVASGVLSGTGLPGRVQKAAGLAEAWDVRGAFWDDAWLQVRNSKYLGSIADLRAPEAALAKAEAELNIPEFTWYLKRVMTAVEASDVFAHRQAM